MKTLFACIILTTATAVSTHATAQATPTPRAAAFAVPAQQILTLGIQTAPLQNASGAVRASYPAQVIVPPDAEQIISSPIAGLVTQLLVQQHQQVRAGAPLLRIASPELGQMQLQLLHATSRATLARQTARREQQLFDEGIIPARRAEEARAALSEAEAALIQAKTALRLSGMASATIEQVAATGKPQDSLTLTASRAGVVTEIEARAGLRVDAATALLHVLQTDTLWLDIQVPATAGTSWKPGTQMTIQGRAMTARLLSTGVTVATGSQTVGMRAVVDGKAGLRPGEFVTVELPASASPNSWDVPLAAVAHDGNQAYVFVRSATGFEARAVNVMASAAQRVRVQGALKAGEQIAISGVVALKGAWLNGKEDK